MDFALTEEQRMIRQMCRRFSDEVIIPRAAEIEESGRYPYEIMEQMAQLGMMGIPYPVEYGGSGGDWVSMHLCVEEISRGDISLGALLDASTCVAVQEIYAFGTEEQKRKWLVPLAEGREVAAFGLTEPGAGSDAASIRATARPEGDHWVINGTKQFITNIGLENASLIVVAAVSGRTPQGRPLINTFVVPKGTPGFLVGQPYRKIGWNASATHEVVFEDCRVPRENLLGEEGRGLAQHLYVLQTGRITIGAMAVGLMQACLDEALSYAKERVQFGRPIASFQGVSFKLADMAMCIELSRLMYLKASWLKDQGLPHTAEAAYAKLFASEMAEKVASDALQIHGGYGYIQEYPVSRYYRAAKLLQIVEGTSEVQRMVISRQLGCPDTVREGKE